MFLVLYVLNLTNVPGIKLEDKIIINKDDFKFIPQKFHIYISLQIIKSESKFISYQFFNLYAFIDP